MDKPSAWESVFGSEDSAEEFIARFVGKPSTSACRHVLRRTARQYIRRWGNGSNLPTRGDHLFRWNEKRRVWICCRCKRLMSPVSLSIFRHTRVPLTVWFELLWWFAERQREKQPLRAVDVQARFPQIQNVKTAQRMLSVIRREFRSIDSCTFEVRFAPSWRSSRSRVFRCHHSGYHRLRGVFVGDRPLEDFMAGEMEETK
jgi:hypothetical protein